MTCPKCNQPKNYDDFYWRKNNPSERIYRDCKCCVREKQTIVNRTRQGYKKDPLYAYFH